MNYSTAVFLINDSVRAIACTYESADNSPRTIFKTFDQSIKKDDFVLVPTETRHKMTVCKVVEVDVEPDIETTQQMNWIIGPVERDDYERTLEQEKAAIDTMKQAEKNRRRDELRKSLLAHVEGEIKALPISHVKDVG
jgi:predicted Mrr-cat superfamily restriction endonuclease